MIWLGLSWFGIGFWLFSLGISLLLHGSGGPLIRFFDLLGLAAQESALLWLVIALLLGSVKSRKLLSKVVSRNKVRIAQGGSVYTKKDLFLVVGMMALGIVVRFFSDDVRGVIDLAVGAALIQASLGYFIPGVRAGDQKD